VVKRFHSGWGLEKVLDALGGGLFRFRPPARKEPPLLEPQLHPGLGDPRRYLNPFVCYLIWTLGM
jgi:hypothetical protein